MAAENRNRWLALMVLCLGSFMIVLDTTIVNVALPSIRTELHFNESSLAWVVNAYMLFFGGFLLLGGRLGEGYRFTDALPGKYRLRAVAIDQNLELWDKTLVVEAGKDTVIDLTPADSL